jgi:DNA-directed RNA polymerase specialized sigma24 family protein
MSLVEAGKILGVSGTTVNRRLDRGLRILTERLGDLRPIVPDPI